MELDVHLTKDGHLAVCHDETIQRVTGEKGTIRGMTLAELKTAMETFTICVRIASAKKLLAEKEAK